MIPLLLVSAIALGSLHAQRDALAARIVGLTFVWTIGLAIAAALSPSTASASSPPWAIVLGLAPGNALAPSFLPAGSFGATAIASIAIASRAISLHALSLRAGAALLAVLAGHTFFDVVVSAIAGEVYVRCATERA